MPNMQKLKKRADKKLKKKLKKKHRDMPDDPRKLALAMFAHADDKLKKRRQAEEES